MAGRRSDLGQQFSPEEKIEIYLRHKRRQDQFNDEVDLEDAGLYEDFDKDYSDYEYEYKDYISNNLPPERQSYEPLANRPPGAPLTPYKPPAAPLTPYNPPAAPLTPASRRLAVMQRRRALYR